MKLSLERMQALIPPGALDDNIFQSIVAQVKASGQGLIFDTDLIKEEAIRDLAVEVATEHPEVRATDEDAVQQEAAARKAAVEKAGAARVAWWFHTGQNGKRLARITFNQNRIVEFLDKYGQGLTVAAVDKAIEVLDGVLQWEQPAPATPPPPAPAPPPEKRLLPNREEELDLNTPDFLLAKFSVAQIRDLDARRNPNRRAPTYGFEPLPQEVSAKAIKRAPLALLKSWRDRFGQQALDDRLAGRS